MQYKIYEEFFEDVKKKLNRIGKKCAKHGNPFTFEVVGSVIDEVENKETKEKSYYKFMIVEVEGTAKINNYECVAVLEKHESGNVIRRINTEIEIPERFKFTENVCEHCNCKRQRNELYVIHNVETDEFKQVGSSCLMLYTNGLNAEYVASYINGITKLEEFDGFIGSGGKSYIPIDEVLGYSVEIINKMGYFNSNSDCPTKYLVSDMLYKRDSFEDRIRNINRTLKNNKFSLEFDSKDFLKDDTENIVKEIIKYYMSLKNDSEFINNVQVLLNDGYVEWQNLGFLCYLPEGYYKHIKREAKKAEQNLIDEKSEHFGEVGKRYKNQKVYEVRILTGWGTQYGYTYLYKIVLESGNVLIWKSTNWCEESELNNVDTITFTVKAHGEYNGVKQTDVSRCKLNMKAKEVKISKTDNTEDNTEDVLDALDMLYE